MQFSFGRRLWRLDTNFGLPKENCPAIQLHYHCCPTMPPPTFLCAVLKIQSFIYISYQHLYIFGEINMFILLFLTPIGRWKKFRGNDEAEQMKKMHTFLVGRWKKFRSTQFPIETTETKWWDWQDEYNACISIHSYAWVINHSFRST